MIESDLQHELFPVTLSASWCSEKAAPLPVQLKDWLLDPSSLTQRLKSSSTTFGVQVLGQQITTCSNEEANEDIHAGQEVLVREVLLFCDDQPHVFARSLLPLSSLTGEEKKLASLGNQSLGQVLFNHPKLQRKRIEVADFDHNSTVAKVAGYFQQTVEGKLWGRRSTFVIEDKPLMVAEVFLPAAIAYQARIKVQSQ